MAWRCASCLRERRIERFSDVDAGEGRALIDYLDLVTRISAGDKQKTFSAQQIGAGMHVLDVGCGTGDDVRAIAELVGEAGRAVGIDPSRVMIDEALERGVPSNAEFLVGSAGDLPFGDAAFDAVRAERVFQHLADADSAASEIRRVLKPLGTALLLDQDWETLCVAGAHRDVTRRIVRAFADHVANGLAGREARGVLRRAGFSRVDIAPLVATPIFPVAFDLILQPALNAALGDGAIDEEAGKQWLLSLLQADQRGEFFCAVIVVVALAHV
jgi:ubiquinone/menaquinone biosynthesis C-methylase UbiE